MKRTIINANSDLGVSVSGSNLGPRNISSSFENECIVNVDYKNVTKSLDKNDLRKNFDALVDFNDRLYKEIVKRDEFIITLGGDHSIVISSALASLKKNKDIGIIWIDAHPDFNTFETTITGNIHGLPLATIAGINGNDLTLFHNNTFINKDNIVIIGARAIDPKEQELLDKNNIKVFYDDYIQNNDILKIMDEAFSKAGNNKKIHVSFDLDVINPKYIPGVSVPEKDGLSIEQADLIFDYICKHINKVASIDIVEYNPLKDKDDITKKYATKLLKKLINFLD